MYDVETAKTMGSVEYTVVLSDMFETYLRLKENNLLISNILHGDGLMYYTHSQCFDRCAIREDSFRSAIKKFTELGFFEVVVNIGMPSKKHYKLNIINIYNYLNSNKDYSYLKTGNKIAENRQHVSCFQLHNDKKNDIYKEPKIIVNAKPSSSSQAQSAVLFDPVTFRLENGMPLSPRTRQAFAKYKGKDLEKLLANVHYYQHKARTSIKPIDNHERYLQNCVNKNYADGWDGEFRNKLYAETMKGTYNLKDLVIKKTVINFDLKDGQGTQSVSLRLPHSTFTDILDKYIEKVA